MDRESALKLQYDAVATEYDGVDQGLSLVLARLKLPPGASVLDIGCGTGNLTLRLPERETLRRVVGVDISDGVLDIARAHARVAGLANFGFLRANACDLPFPPGEFDAVVSNMVLHLLPDRRKAFAEALRVLKSSGKAVLQFHGGGAVAPEWMEIFRRAWRSALPERELPALMEETTIGRVEAILAELGLHDFDIAWRHRTREVAESDVPKALKFSRMVLGFWRWGLPDETVRLIEKNITEQIAARAARGEMRNTVNVLLVEFVKPTPA